MAEFSGFSGGDVFADRLNIGPQGTADTFDCIRVVTVAVDPASLDAVTAVDTAVTIAGVATTDFVVAMPPDLTDGLVYGGCRVSAADTVQVRIGNVTAGAINPASADWVFLIFETA